SVCWLGSARYNQPLDETQAKKWAMLTQLHVDMYVIGFATDLRFHRFAQAAHFFLLPELPAAPLRYIELFVLAPGLLLWLVLRHNIQVIVSQSPIDGAIGAFVKLVARILGRRIALVVESHGDFTIAVLRQRESAGIPLYRILLSVFSRFALHHADALRVISSVTRQQLEALAPGKSIVVFMAWTDDDAFRHSVRTVSLAACRDILYAGVLVSGKGVHVLVDAFARVAEQIPECKLYLVGKAENLSYTRQLQAQVEQLGLSPRVIFTGVVSQQELASYMGRARVLVLPSFSEGLGRVLVEAMLCGTPAIGSGVGGIPDVVQDGVNGYLVPPGDVDALANRLVEVLNDPEIEAMGVRARAFAEAFFSPEAYVEGYRRLLDEALKAVRHDREPAAV
ncbi:MAG: glycosyltransferase, partial [Anaerolineae bacterium]|nr:glycosyltransferase [Anaerolineae bacterium]